MPDLFLIIIIFLLVSFINHVLKQMQVKQQLLQGYEQVGVSQWSERSTVHLLYLLTLPGL